MKKKGKTEYNVTPEEFIKIWQTSESVTEVSDKTGMPEPIVHARASNYRQAGIRLKKMPRKNRLGLDVERLNKLIEVLEKKGKEMKNLRMSPEEIKKLLREILGEDQA